jgi:hypothetical protein
LDISYSLLRLSPVLLLLRLRSETEGERGPSERGGFQKSGIDVSKRNKHLGYCRRTVTARQPDARHGWGRKQLSALDAEEEEEEKEKEKKEKW